MIVARICFESLSNWIAVPKRIEILNALEIVILGAVLCFLALGVD